MPLTVKKMTLWRAEVDNQPGALAKVIGQPAKAGADFKVMMGYRHPSAAGKATIEVFPVTSKKVTDAAVASGLSAAAIPAVWVQGSNKAGFGYQIAEALAQAQINIAFLMAHVISEKFAAVIGFESEQDAEKAMPLISKAGRAGRG